MDRELLYVFGTGNAAVTNLYNTCFALRDSDEYFMVDAGGGNGILKIRTICRCLSTGSTTSL